MSKYDAERALKIYKTFSKQTDQVVQFLSVARQYENATRLEIPKLKHAPTSLTASLEEYLHDPDFEINRRQYLSHQDAKKGGKSIIDTPAKSTPNAKSAPGKDFPEPKPASVPAPAATKPQEHKGPAPDLIDFFDSIEQNQQPMPVQAQQMPNIQTVPQFFQQAQPSTFSPAGEAPFIPNGQPQQQQINSFTPINSSYGPSHNPAQQAVQPDFTGTSFGGYSQQPFGQQPNQFPSLPQAASPEGFPQQQHQQPSSTGQQPLNIGSSQSTNPFRQASMPTGVSSSSFTNPPTVASPLTRQGTNPFARSNPSIPPVQNQTSPFPTAPPQQSPQSFPPQAPQQPFTQQQPTQPMQPQRTGTNPFARNIPIPSSSQTSTPPPPAMVPSITGSTNPFRQSTFVNQQTGQGWQSNQGSMGGLEQLPTVSVFPRPGQSQQPPQQQPWP